ncbi:E3 ubiquitin-protein ligase RNF19A-like [Salvelinus namaycush]|uniref:E3 ubiquitin-protein ligase RNF19A-like n=1 Tax=Salvelinus namaycush TaxID=8040 RepID=A0A8U0U877_SALNM|nr:E3 ubiquitin-protein ligase RNF19A-like [Salvelinus namaycush]
MAGSILNYMPLDREGSLEVDMEGKQEKKLHHHSNSSSLDDGSGEGRGVGVCPSGCPHESRSSKWVKDPSSSGGKKSKGKLRTKKSSGGTKIQETREDMDAQLLEQRSTNSSEFDSPSLSGSLPSVADSHCSHLSEFSCSDPETSRPPPLTPCCIDLHPQRPLTSLGTDLVTVTPLPEVENDHLENCPAASHSSSPSSSAPVYTEGGLGGMLLYIAEESLGLMRTTQEELDSLAVEEVLKETNNNMLDGGVVSQQPSSPVRSGCIQTEI